MIVSEPELAWDQSKGELSFRTRDLEGVIKADGKAQGVTRLVHRPTGVSIGPLLLAPYRLLARNAWMGELRDMEHRAAVTEAGLQVTWAPRPAHLTQVTIEFLPREPNLIDLYIDVVGHGYYPGYELFLSNYFADGFACGGYVASDSSNGAIEQVCPESCSVYRGMYVAFPRDEAAAHLITDGRWQRGRHWTRFLPARYYGLPVGFYAHCSSSLDAVVMGTRHDVFAVSMAYSGDPRSDKVVAHRSLYLHLFGRDLHPGERWRTCVRFAVGEYARDPGAHRSLLAEFEKAVSSRTGSFPVEPAELFGLFDPVRSRS